MLIAKRYRQRTQEVEAIQWIGKNTQEVTEFILSKGFRCVMERRMDTPIYIITDHGKLQMDVSDWLLVNPENKPVIWNAAQFEKNYEPIPEK